METGTVYTVSGSAPDEKFRKLLAASGLAAKARSAHTILIKPNLVEALPPPVTTPVAVVEALVDYLQANCSATILIGEGTASHSYDTMYVFSRLGYVDLARARGLELVDLNEEKTVCRRRPDCERCPEMHLPEIVYDSFLLSVPVLKAHTMDGVTLTMKNMMGLAPPACYQQPGSWKKSSFHHRLGHAVADLNRYRCPDFTLLDATVGMAEAHLFGPLCEPPVQMFVAGSDPVAVDGFAAGLLGRDWRRIDHIRRVHGELGQAEPLAVVAVDRDDRQHHAQSAEVQDVEQ